MSRDPQSPVHTAGPTAPDPKSEIRDPQSEIPDPQSTIRNPHSLRVLILEDRPADAELMVAELRRHGFDTQWTRVDTEEDFVAALDEGLDVVLSDFSLPGFDALRAIAHVNRRALTVPVIVVSGTMGEETAAQCIREGAADYLLKDRLGRLGSAIERSIDRRRLLDERHQIEKALIQSQSELATVFDSAPVAMVILDSERRIVRANRAASLLAGRPAGDAFGRLPGDAFGCAIALDDPTGCRSGDQCAACPLRTVVTDTLEHGAAHHAVECTLPFAGHEAGATPTMLVSTSPIETTMGTLVVVALEDITARKQAEDRERKLNRLLGTIREINQLIVREKSRTWMLAETCRITVEQGQFVMAWIGEADHATGEVRPLAAAGDEAGYLAKISVRYDDSAFGRGPVGTSIQERRTVVVDDVAADALMAPWRDAALARGYRSVVSLPLVVNKRLFGVIAVYATDAGAFDAEIVSLLEELAEDVGFAVGALETAEERERAELALHESEERHRQLFEAESDAILLIDNATGAILEANTAAEALYGYTRDELLTLKNHDLSAEPEDTRLVTTGTSIEPDQVIRIPQRRHRRKDGTELPVEITGRFFVWRGRPVHVAAIRDISERRRAEEALRRDLEVRAALNAISRIVIGDEIRVPEVAAAVLEHARRLTSSEHGFVSEIDLVSGDSVCHTLTEMLAGACGVTGEDRRIAFPRSPNGTYAGLWSRVLNTREAFFTNHAPSHPAVNGTPAGHVSLERYLAVPVVSGGELLGMIALANAERDYSPDDLEVIGRLADYYGVAIQRARWEDALQESEERYRTLFEQAPTGIYRSTPDGRILAANPALVRMLGYDSFEEMAPIDLTREGYAKPDSRQAFRERVDAEGVVTGFESEWRTRDGRTVFVRENARAICHDSGEVAFYEGTVEDVSDWRRSDEALKASEKRYRLFFEEDLTADYMSTLDGRLVDCNPAYVKLFGFRDRDEAMATSVLNLYPRPEDRTSLIGLLEDRGWLENHELELRRHDGAPLFVIANLGLMLDQHRRPAQIKGYLFDVTSRRALEEQLLQAQKMEAVGRLAGGVAHDFNNLLQALLSQAQLVRAFRSQPDRLPAVADELEQHVHRGAALTRQLLLFSRRETSRRQNVDLNTVVQGQANMLRRLVRENIAFRIELSPDPLPVEADAGQVEQVLMNLVVNASDALAGGGMVTLRSGRGPDGTVWASVADNGPGVPGAIRDRIFEPFFTTKPAGQGTGLGLSVVHGIITQHGGSITVGDTEGGGSVFTFSLPMAGSGAHEPVPELAPVGATMSRGNGERVLVVEDEAGTREALSELIGALGFQVHAVGDAEEALRVPHEPRFDLLLTDLMLPGMVGTELAESLRRRWPGLQVILMSGYTEDEVVRQGVDGGDVRFLQKPFDMKALARELRAALDARSES